VTPRDTWEAIYVLERRFPLQRGFFLASGRGPAGARGLGASNRAERRSVFGIVRGRKSEQDERVVSAANGGGRTRREVKMRGPVVGCPRYYSGLRGCGQTFTVGRYYAEGRLVQCPYCGLFFPKDLP
jgi:hypothetical protein